MKRFMLLSFLLCLTITGCTNTVKAQRILEQNGYTNVQMTGYDPFMCSEGDDFSDGFTATSPKGMQVEGAVCSGIMKGATIRFK